MTDTFHELLQNEHGDYQQLISQCKVISMPCFGDLIWPGDAFDPFGCLKDPGIHFARGARTFVLIRVHDEIRYYAGSDDVTTNSTNHEIGCFSAVTLALRFGIAFLIDTTSLSQITIERQIRYSS